MVVNPRELYEPVTWTYVSVWNNDTNKEVYSVAELFQGEIEPWKAPPMVMDQQLSPAEFVALWESLPPSQVDETIKTAPDGVIEAVRFEFEMTGKQRADWFL